MSHCSVQTTAHPPSAFTPRIAAMALGYALPIPLQCGTWKKRFFATTGPIRTRSNRTSKREGRAPRISISLGRVRPRAEDRAADAYVRCSALDRQGEIGAHA